MVVKDLSNVVFITREQKGYSTHYYVRRSTVPKAPTSIRIAEIVLNKHNDSIKEIYFMMEDDMLKDMLKGSGFDNQEELIDRIKQCVVYLSKPSKQTTVALETSSIMV